MEVLTTDFLKTNFHSPLMKAYLNGSLDPSLYTEQPSDTSFEKQFKLKSVSYDARFRKVLVDTLKSQYAALRLEAPKVAQNIDRLGYSNTFTVCTGHQLNLFTGPLFFIYKILHTIKLSQHLNERFPDKHCVPVYWMATEDHDSAEIDHLYLKGVKLKWHTDQTGAVGEFLTTGIEEVIIRLKEILPQTEEATQLVELFSSAYTKGNSLAQATMILVHELFKSYGLVVLDPQHPDLKALFKPVFKAELADSFSEKAVAATSTILKEAGMNVQVNPREINLFFVDANRRERILRDREGFMLAESERRFSRDELFELLDRAPEHFSPNVVLRLVYQETILPNLAYVGGGGELSYALQLKSTFEGVSVSFPLFVLRNSVFWVTAKDQMKMKTLGAQFADFTSSKDAAINGIIRRISDIDIDFSEQRAMLHQQFEKLKALAERTDKSFLGAVQAQEAKQLKGLDRLEKRLLKAQKRKLIAEVQRVGKWYDQWYPMGTPHERVENFSLLYAYLGQALFDKILEAYHADLGHGTLLLITLPEGITA
jgi:bacillithiol biosynthesis cysteine-adding enzyme BshC